MNGRICPLLFASAADIEVECRPDSCAWACGDECAMLTIAKSLDDLSDRGIIAMVETEDD